MVIMIVIVGWAYVLSSDQFYQAVIESDRDNYALLLLSLSITAINIINVNSVTVSILPNIDVTKQDALC